MLGHGLAGAEASGYCGGASLCNREEGVDNALTGYKGLIHRKPLLCGAGLADGPKLAKGKLLFVADLVLNGDNVVV